jgi:hypothetical protein
VHDRVRIEQEQVVADGLGGGTVDSAREPEILLERDQAGLRELRAQRFGRPVPRRVVQHDDLERDARRALVERGQALADLVATAEGDNDDRDVHSRRVGEDLGIGFTTVR